MLSTLGISILLSTTPVTAKPYVLKCTEVEVEGFRPELTVDLDRRVMKWGELPQCNML
jgi:hypothetical protein